MTASGASCQRSRSPARPVHLAALGRPETSHYVVLAPGQVMASAVSEVSQRTHHSWDLPAASRILRLEVKGP